MIGEFGLCYLEKMFFFVLIFKGEFEDEQELFILESIFGSVLVVNLSIILEDDDRSDGSNLLSFFINEFVSQCDVIFKEDAGENIVLLGNQFVVCQIK